MWNDPSGPEWRVSYDAFLAQAAEETISGIITAVERNNLFWKGRPECDVARPFFVSESEYRGIMVAATSVTRAINTAISWSRANPELAAKYGLPKVPGDLVDQGTVVTRLDGIMAPGKRVMFIELNPFPAGPINGDLLGRLFEALPVMQNFCRSFPARRIQTAELLLEAIDRGFHKACKRSGVPSIAAIVTPAAASLPNSDIPEMLIVARFLAARGRDVILASLEQIESNGGRLWFDGRALDGLWVDWRSVAATQKEDDFVRMAQDTGTWILNGTGMRLRDSKGLFALLSDPPEGLFDRETLEVLARHIPFTRVVAEELTEYSNAKIDLLEYTDQNRERFVLKPLFATGGEGVLVGSMMQQDQWSVALRSSVGTHVLQEYIPLPADDYPVIDIDRSLASARRYNDICPYVWNDTSAAGLFVRVSPSVITNQSANGTIAPVFIAAD